MIALNKKWLPYALVLISVLLIYILDTYNSRVPEQEKEASTSIPKAVITIDGQEVLYKSGTFSWVEKGIGPVVDQDEPPILFHDLLPVSVKPFSKLKITYLKKPGLKLFPFIAHEEIWKWAHCL